MITLTAADIVRFWAWVIVGKPWECWEWQGTAPGGYGRFSVGGRKGKAYPAHKIAYVIKYGEVPPDHDVHHKCRNTLCCNPDHLEPKHVTSHPLEAGHGAAKQKAKTHCDNGHEYTPENTAYDRGFRRCKECNRQRSRELYAERAR